MNLANPIQLGSKQQEVTNGEETMKQIVKAFSGLLTAICVLGLVAGPAQAQSTPTATYNTDVFQYWHLNGETWAKRLPPLPPEEADNLRELGHSLGQTAALWGFSLPTFDLALRKPIS